MKISIFVMKLFTGAAGFGLLLALTACSVAPLDLSHLITDPTRPSAPDVGAPPIVARWSPGARGAPTEALTFAFNAPVTLERGDIRVVSGQALVTLGDLPEGNGFWWTVPVTVHGSGDIEVEIVREGIWRAQKPVSVIATTAGSGATGPVMWATHTVGSPRTNEIVLAFSAPLELTDENVLIDFTGASARREGMIREANGMLWRIPVTTARGGTVQIAIANVPHIVTPSRTVDLLGGISWRAYGYTVGIIPWTQFVNFQFSEPVTSLVPGQVFLVPLDGVVPSRFNDRLQGNPSNMSLWSQEVITRGEGRGRVLVHINHPYIEHGPHEIWVQGDH